MTTSNLAAFFQPRGIAVVGASADPAKIGGRRFRSLIEGEFKGQVYPVNPASPSVQGVPAYKTISDVPEPLDLAVIVVRAELVPDAVAECAKRSVPGIMVITAGFGETNHQGRQLERQMVAQVNAYGGRLIGPNCAGIFDSCAGMNLGGLELPAGPIGLVSQSGNIVLDLALHAREAGTGFSRYASIGNGADVRPTDVIEDLLNNDATQVVLAYIEGWNDNEGRQLHDLVRGHAAGKRVVVIKPGRSELGRNAALSHTGALAGEDRIVDAAFRSAGIWRAANPGEALHVAAALSRYEPLQSNRVAVLTDGGGHATLLADALGQAGFDLPVFDQETQSKLSSFLPERCAIENPVDFAGVAEEQPDAIASTIEVCRQVPEIDVIALAGHFGGYHDNGGPETGHQEKLTAKSIARISGTPGPPIFIQSIHAGRNKPALQHLKACGLSVVRSPHELVPVLSALKLARRIPTASSKATVSRNDEAEKILNDFDSGHPALPEPESRAFLAANGLSIPDWHVDADPNRLAAACPDGEKLALKLIVPGLVHRSDVGGVTLNIAGKTAIAVAARNLIDRGEALGPGRPRVMATRMARPGLEIVFGALRDRHFGPVVMFGLGGIHLEAIDDVVFGIAPMDHSEAQDLIHSVRAHDLLFGSRGSDAIDIDAAAQLLIELGNILSAYPQIAEIDLNPVIASKDGLVIADARIILTSAS